jgi:hypothetical protein
MGEDKMEKGTMLKSHCSVIFFLFLGIASLLAGPAYAESQIVSPSSAAASDEVGEIVLKRLPPVDMMHAAATDGPYMVRALAVGLANFLPEQADWAIFDFSSEYYSGQTWYWCFVVVNYNNIAKNIKTQWHLWYNDGAGRLTKYIDKTVPARTVMLYYYSVAGYVAKKGLFTLTGRVYGTQMGNANEVTSQVYIY